MTHKCEACGRAFPKPKAVKAKLPAEMTEKELYAYYKRTAPVSDLLFTRRNASPVLKGEIDRRLAGKPTAKDAAEMRYLRRIELGEAERAAGIPAIGSEAWRIAEGISPNPYTCTADSETPEAA